MDIVWNSLKDCSAFSEDDEWLCVYLPKFFSGRQRHGELRQSSKVLDANSHLFRAPICKNVNI